MVDEPNKDDPADCSITGLVDPNRDGSAAGLAEPDTDDSEAGLVVDPNRDGLSPDPNIEVDDGCSVAGFAGAAPNMDVGSAAGFEAAAEPNMETGCSPIDVDPAPNSDEMTGCSIIGLDAAVVPKEKVEAGFSSVDLDPNRDG